MAKFIALQPTRARSRPVSLTSPLPPPADFGWPAQDDGSRNDPLVGQNIMSCHRYQHDSGALRAASARVVIAVAAESSTMTAGRAGRRRGRTARDHARHLPGRPRRIPGGEYGRTGDPDAFAATVRQVLTS